jgi:hypothetical protein
VRSRAQRGVSNQGRSHAAPTGAASFETHRCAMLLRTRI